MALIEDELPDANVIRSNFREREDHSLAHRLQEQEFEDHFNCNVQQRRTARVDVGVAKNLQKAEVKRYKEEESLRRGELLTKEEQDREHAKQIAQVLKEEEDIQMALKMQDENIAKKMFDDEQKQITLRKQQEQEDSHLARQASVKEEQAIKERKKKEIQLSEAEIKRMEMKEKQQLEKKRHEEHLSENEGRRLHLLQQKQALEQKQRKGTLSDVESRTLKQLQLECDRRTGRPAHTDGGSATSNSVHGPASIPPGGRSSASQKMSPSSSLPPQLAGGGGVGRRTKDSVDFGRQGNSRGPTVSSSLPPSIPVEEKFQLPSYDDFFGGGQEEEEEVVLDENERIALQEAEDERLARELSEVGVNDSERQRREHEDLEFARKLQEEEAKRKGKSQSPHHQADQELAKRLHQQELESKQRLKNQKKPSFIEMSTTLPGEDEASLELAKHLQREEVMKLRQLKQQKVAQQNVIEAEMQQRKQQKTPSSTSRVPGSQQQPQTSNSVSSKTLQGTKPSSSQAQQAARSVPSQTLQGTKSKQSAQSNMIPQGQDSSPVTLTSYAYQPAMAGHQVPLGAPQARPSYKRDQGKKKGKK